MSLIKYEPLSLLSRMQRDLDDFFRRSEEKFPSMFPDNTRLLDTEWSPRIDIKEDEKQFLVTADIPGVSPKDIQVTMESNVLSIRGERKEEQEETKKHYRRRECMMGSFERSFVLPETADGSNISASGKHGVLTVTIPKKPAAKPTTIPIKTEE